MVGIGTSIVHGRTAWLAHIIVHKDHRNAGIGSALTQALIHLTRKTPARTIMLIATALGEPVYKKLGFETETQYVFMDRGVLPPADSEIEITPFHPRYREELLHLDLQISGEHRERLLHDHLTTTHLVLLGSSLQGFYVPTLGEGLILASDSRAGLALMKLRFAASQKFCLPVKNEVAFNFLTNHGFTEERRASRMILGEKIAWDATKIFSRIGGNLG